jgi:hypothetical protein
VVDGADGQVTNQAIRLFQAVVQADGRGRPIDRAKNNATVSGTITSGSSENAWLNAVNAPVWQELPVAWQNAAVINYETWTSSWEVDIIGRAIAAQPDIAGRVTALTEFPDIYGTVHASHQAGHSVDIGFRPNPPANTAAVAIPPNITEESARADYVFGQLDSGGQRVASEILAMWNAAGDQFRSVIVGSTPADFARIKQYLSFFLSANQILSVNGHNDHFHMDLKPPAMGAPASASAAPDVSNSTGSGFGTNPRVYYRITLANGFQIAGQVGAEQSLSTVLPPNADYTLTAYQPSSNRSGVYQGRTSSSGVITDLGPIILNQFGGIDSTGDGLPDIGRYVIGLKVGVRSFAGDGIDDATKLEEGLDPLSGLAFPTGVVATLPMPGTVEKLAVAGNKLYAASGSGGLAVVDGTQFNNPIQLGRLSLPGYASGIGVDANLQIAAVATGSALQLVDVSNGMAPKLLHSVAVAATQVVVSDGLAYATSGSSFSVVDLESGNIIQRLTLPMSTVTGLARDGSFLYAYGANTLAIIDVTTEGAARVRGHLSVSIASSDVGVFAANGIVWLAGSGLRTINVSNPDAPTLIHGADVTFTARRVALNGSGLGVLAPADSGTCSRRFAVTLGLLVSYTSS